MYRNNSNVIPSNLSTLVSLEAVTLDVNYVTSVGEIRGDSDVRRP